MIDMRDWEINAQCVMNDFINQHFKQEMRAQESLIGVQNALKGNLEKIMALKGFFNQAGNDVNVEDGVSFLSMKNQVLLEYEACLHLFIMMKVRGEPTKDHDVVKRLLSLRIVLDKIRPIEKKIQYQLDKMIRTAKLENSDSSRDDSKEQHDPLSFQPRLGDLTTADLNAAGGDSMDVDEEANAEKAAKGVYVPPKNRMVAFEEEQEMEIKQKKREQKLKKKLDSSAIVQYVREEFSDAPQEFTAYGVGEGAGPSKFDQERQAFEEDNFLRLSFTKSDKKKMGQMGKSKRDRIDAFEDFDDFSDLAHFSKRLSTQKHDTPSEKSGVHRVRRKKNPKRR